MPEFSDYIIYADESGSASIDGTPDPGFPLFVLSAVLVEKQHYAEEIVPEFQQLKFDFVGHDQLILHERDIRRQKGDFAFLQVGQELREEFLERINSIIVDSEIEVFAAVIDKAALKARYANPWSPYEISLVFVMERLLKRLLKLGQKGKLVHIAFECRGKKEDAELELAFRRIAANKSNWGYKNPDFTQIQWEPLFVDKKSNSSGLQLADLVARPIGLRTLRPKQENHAYKTILKKLTDKKIFP